MIKLSKRGSRLTLDTHLLAELGYKPEQLGEAVQDEHQLEVKLVEAPAEIHLLVVDVAVAHLLAKGHQLLVSLDGIQTLKDNISINNSIDYRV